MSGRIRFFWEIILFLSIALMILAVETTAQNTLLDPPHDVAPGPVSCVDCHDMAAFDQPNLIPPDGLVPENIDDWRYYRICEGCHDSITATLGHFHSSEKTTAKYGAWTVSCTVCHNQHTQEQDDAFGTTYGKFIRRHIDLSEILDAAQPGGNTVPGKSGIKGVKFTGPADFADGDATIDGICEVCHTKTNHHTNSGPGDNGHYAQWNCVEVCHTKDNSLEPGDNTCLDCHDESVSSRAAVGQQFNSNSHHIQTGSPVTSVQTPLCFQCHWEADANGKVTSHHTASPGSPVDLVIRDNVIDATPASRPATYTLGTTAVQYWAGTSSAQVINPHCLGCHNDDFNGYTTGGGIFGDGKAPNQYAWDGESIAAKYSDPGTARLGKYDNSFAAPQYAYNAAEKDVTKAYSAHGNPGDNARGWDDRAATSGGTGVDGAITDTSGSVQVACFDCHNSHGSGAGNIDGSTPTTSYASATTYGGILKDVANGKGGYTTDYTPDIGGSIADRNPRNPGASLCIDCHLTETEGTKPWGYSSTYGASQPIIGYFDSEEFAPGDSGPKRRYPYKAFESNEGGHFWASTRIDADNSGMFSSPKHDINGLCTPCHDPHGVSPSLGPNRPYGVPMLKGTWLSSPYKEDAAPLETNLQTGRYGPDKRSTPGYHIDQNTFVNYVFSSTTGVAEDVSVFAGLCLRCHTNDGTAADIDPDTAPQDNQWGTMDRVHETVKGWGAGAKHKFSCSKCHTPHNGSALPRLMVTNCLDFDHRGQVDAGGYPTYVASAGSSGPSGSGSGRGQFPGGGNGGGDGWLEGPFSYAYNFGSYTVSCHDTPGLNDLAWPYNQHWNEVTHWSATPPAAPTLASPQAVSVGYDSATLRANITNEGGAAITEHGTVWSESPLPTANPTLEGVAPRGVFNSARAALTPGVKIYYRGYATNSAGTGYSPQGSFYTEPSVPIVNITDFTGTTMTVSWSPGLTDGDGVIVLMRQGAAVTAGPPDGTNTDGYTPNALFGYGSQIGAGNFVVHKGSITTDSVVVTGLSPSTTYHVAVYAYKGTVNTVAPNLGTNYSAAGTASEQTTASGYSQTFTYTGAVQPLTISSGATNIMFIVEGAGGGGGRPDEYGSGGDGGYGHEIVMQYGDAASNISLSVYVGGGGQISSSTDESGGAGGYGYNPGIFGGDGDVCDADFAWGGAGGGGSSAIYNNTAPELAVEAAGGNGGHSNGWWSDTCYINYGDGDLWGGGGGAGCSGCTDFSTDAGATYNPTGGGTGGARGTFPQNGGNGQVKIIYECAVCP